MNGRQVLKVLAECPCLLPNNNNLYECKLPCTGNCRLVRDVLVVFLFVSPNGVSSGRRSSLLKTS